LNSYLPLFKSPKLEKIETKDPMVIYDGGHPTFECVNDVEEDGLKPDK
jgi:hypothetical protein